MPFESFAAGVPAGLNLAVKSAQTGFETSKVPEETRELFQTIYSIRNDILTAKDKRKELAYVCDDNYLRQWDRSIQETESALASLEKLVEPSRVDVQLNDRVKLRTKLMWVVRDSKSLPATSHRLNLAHNQMIKEPSVLGMRQDPRQLNSHNIDHDPPPPYIAHHAATKRAIAERRKENRERINSLGPEGPTPHFAPPCESLSNTGRSSSPNVASTSTPSSTQAANQFPIRTRTIGNPAYIPTRRSTVPSNPAHLPLHSSHRSPNILSLGPQASLNTMTPDPLMGSSAYPKRTFSQPSPAELAYSSASLTEHLLERERVAPVLPSDSIELDGNPVPLRLQPVQEVVTSPVEIYDSPAMSPVERMNSIGLDGGHAALTTRPFRASQRVPRKPVPSQPPSQPLFGSPTSDQPWETVQEQRTQHQQRQQKPRPPYPPSIAPATEEQPFHSSYAVPPPSPPPPAAPPVPRTRQVTRPPYPPSIVETTGSEPDVNPFLTPAPSPPPTLVPASAPKNQPRRRPPYPPSIVEGIETHAYSAPGPAPAQTPEPRPNNPYQRANTAPPPPQTTRGDNNNNNGSTGHHSPPSRRDRGNARWQPTSAHNATSEQSPDEIPIPMGRWTGGERDSRRDSESSGDDVDAQSSDGTGLPYPDFPEAGYMAYRPPHRS